MIEGGEIARDWELLCVQNKREGEVRFRTR